MDQADRDLAFELSEKALKDLKCTHSFTVYTTLSLDKPETIEAFHLFGNVLVDCYKQGEAKAKSELRSKLIEEMFGMYGSGTSRDHRRWEPVRVFVSDRQKTPVPEKLVHDLDVTREMMDQLSDDDLIELMQITVGRFYRQM